MVEMWPLHRGCFGSRKSMVRIRMELEIFRSKRTIVVRIFEKNPFTQVQNSVRFPLGNSWGAVD